MENLINWPDWMKDGVTIVKDKDGSILLSDCFSEVDIDTTLGYWIPVLPGIYLIKLQYFFHIPDNFITEKYLSLDWENSRVTKGVAK